MKRLLALLLLLPLVAGAGDLTDGLPDNTSESSAVKDYAGLFAVGNATATTFAGTSSDFSQKSQVTIFTTAYAESGADGDPSTDDITIANNGTYLIIANISFIGSNSKVHSFGFFKNDGTTALPGRGSRKLGTGADVGNMSALTVATLSAGDTIELWAQNETDTASITIEDVVFTVTQL